MASRKFTGEPERPLLAKVSSITSRTSAATGRADSRAGAGPELAYGIGCGIAEVPSGFKIISLKPGGPAEAAGVSKGDVVVTVDGKRSSTLGGLRRMLLGPKGTRVELGVKRGGSSLVTAIEVMRGGGSMPQTPLLSIGMGFKHSPQNGCFVVNHVLPGGPADRGGIKGDDLICMFNGESLVNKPGEYLTEMLSNDSEPIVRFGIRRGAASGLISVVVMRTPLNVSNALVVRDSLVSDSSERAPDHKERETTRKAPGVAPGLGGGAGTYSSNFSAMLDHAAGTQGYSSSYDSEKSDAYTSASGGYSSHRGSFLSDSSREEYSSDDNSFGQLSPKAYVSGRNKHNDNSSADESPEPITHGRPITLRSRDAIVSKRSLEETSRSEASKPRISRKSSLPSMSNDLPDKNNVQAKETQKDTTTGAGAIDGNAARDMTAMMQDMRSHIELWHAKTEGRLAVMEAKIAANSIAVERTPSADIAVTDQKTSSEQEHDLSQFISDFQREIQNVRESEQQREKAEKQRELADLERQHKAESDFQSFVEKMHQVVQATENAEKERVQMDSFRHQKELERDEKIASMESELIRIRDEHDSMMEGMDEIKKGVKASMDEFEKKMKHSENELYLEFNKFRSQVFEVITKHEREGTPVVISNNTPATVIERADQIIAIDSPRNSPRKESRTDTQARELTKEAKIDFGSYDEFKKQFDVVASDVKDEDFAEEADQTRRQHLSVTTKGESSPQVNGVSGQLAPLMPRLHLKRCEKDADAPEHLRCDTVVVGQRLFFFAKGRDGMHDLQFAMVMDLMSLKVRAVRVMGLLPMHCRCKFVVVEECLCVIPCDANGRSDLKQAFILHLAEEGRVYSQGCYVELEVPSLCHFHCKVVGRNCLIFCHDGDKNFDLSTTCVLDTEMLTLRMCGNMLAPPSQEITGDQPLPKCEFAVVGFKVLLFMQDTHRMWSLDNIWLVDLNLGMSRRRVEAAKSFHSHASSEAVLRVVGTNVYIFQHDGDMKYDFGTVYVVDTTSCTLAPVTLDLKSFSKRQTRAKILVLQNSFLLVIPQGIEYALDFSEMTLIDTKNPLSPSAEMVRMEVKEHSAQDSRFDVVGEDIYVFPRTQKGSSMNITILSPFQGTCNTFAADIMLQANKGFDIEKSDTSFIFLPYDSNHRRCIGDVSILDSSLVREYR